ncbi:threonine aldolase [Pullulanibacillus pueri]|uniref:Threonine aldolase n=1 Tax=Pullulanibacillus pueri TaxID=1437324 RepID=A0A8J3ELY9_9BACL|nr:low-specificity L-threonine aldolase [Pullulanibacillus pueri]MBM7682746.1 threonine aldolase [Pullulanibacillus pueri]GGH83027.1 threonine aldolase [Pullulanibacillus pueri]
MIDLRSDTVTKPTEAMRRAVYEAEVGDDVYGEDPTVAKLEETAADLLGKEAALFVTSGTQGNQIAVLTHCVAGNEILLEEEAHIFYYEGAAISAFAGVQPRTIKGDRGAMKASRIEAAIRDAEDVHLPETGLICLENTHNRAGGAVVPIENMAELYAIAQKHDIPVHLDGARLFNAAVATQRPVRDFAQYTDTTQICLSKGLGAPVGSLIAGSHAFIKRARKWRKRLGGGLRQAGILAAPGLIALTQMVDRLQEDHDHAKKLADGIANIKGLQVANLVETNIVLVDVSERGWSSSDFVQRLEEQGILANSVGPTAIRMTTNYEVSSKDIDIVLSQLNRL